MFTYRHFKSLFTLTLMVTILGCQSIYYSTMEKFGVEKRDILVDRVDDVKNAQNEASEQFESALDQFATLTHFKGSDLQKQYVKLKREFNKSEERANEVKATIDSVKRVGHALFKEWNAEIKQYTDQRLRKESQQQLARTQIKYNQLLVAMQKSEQRLDPVLNAFRDRVLYLKHNLNAQALTSFQGEVITVKQDVNLLIREMQQSIEAADAFIVAFKVDDTAK